MSVTARSFCSGYTGLEMAVRQAFGDFTVLSHSDIKPAAVRLLEHHYPDIPNLGDMRAIDYTALDRADLMIGSWPCVSHSAAGKRLGKDDPRELWPEFYRAIEATRPAIWFGENVARIATSGELRRVIRDLASLGYVGAWRCVRASDVGACHRRDRCFVVAVDATADTIGEAGRSAGHAEPGDGTGPVSVGAAELGRRDHGSVVLLPSPAAQNVKGPARRLARSDGSPRTYRQTNLPGAIELLPTPKATDGPKGGPNMRGSSGDLALPSAVMKMLPSPTVGDARNTRNATANRSPGQEHHHAGWTLSDVAHAERWGVYATAIAQHERALGRPAPDPTQRSAKTGNPQLSARFVEWMMMLPEGWVCDVPDLVDSPRKSERNAMLSLLGDGVVPAQAAAAFTFLLDHLAQRLTAERAA